MSAGGPDGKGASTTATEMPSQAGGQLLDGSREASVVRELLKVFPAPISESPETSYEGKSSRAALVEGLCRTRPAKAVMAVVDHAFGVVPLLEFFGGDSPAVEAARSGKALASFGFFTANARFAIEPSLVGEFSSDGNFHLTGLLHQGMEEAVSSLVLISVRGEQRLCLVPHDSSGITLRRRSNRQGSGQWLELKGCVVSEGSVSPALKIQPRSHLLAPVERYAEIASYATALCVARLLRALRRAMAEPSFGEAPFSTSQLAAHEVTRLEIEARLLLSATRHADRGASTIRAIAVLAASTALLHRVMVTTEEWAVGLGLEPALEAQGLCRADATELPLARSWTVEGELARRMGLL